MLKFVRIWQHGFIVGLFVGLGALLAAVYAALVLIPVMIAFDVLGRPEPGNSWFELTWLLLLPFGIGAVVRHVNFDDMKANDYPEPGGGTAKALRQAKGGLD